MRLMITAAVAALALVCAGTAADAKGKKAEKSYTFNVQCPALAPVPATVGSCSAKGKNAEAARKSCQAKHNFCYLQEPKKAKKAAKSKKKSKKAKA